MDSKTNDKVIELYSRCLQPRGWDQPSVVDGQARPVPWVTYPAYEMLYQLAKPSWKVFEYGCGNSSLWWSTQVSEVVSVEHNINWANHVRAQRRANLQVLDRPRGVTYAPLPPEIGQAFRFLTDRQAVHESAAVNEEHGLNCPDFVGYVATLMDWPRGYFDAIVVDGMARSLAAYLAGLWVKPTGIVVFDNSDRWQYGPGMEALRGMGFARFDFFGTGPMNTYEWCTSIFAKDLTPFHSAGPRRDWVSDLGW